MHRSSDSSHPRGEGASPFRRQRSAMPYHAQWGLVHARSSLTRRGAHSLDITLAEGWHIVPPNQHSPQGPFRWLTSTWAGRR